MEEIQRKSTNKLSVSVVILAVIILLVHLAEIFFVKDERVRIVFSDIFFPIVNLLVAIALGYAAWRSRIQSRRLSLAWGMLAIAQLCYTLGDLTWAYLEIGLNQDPFPSVADALYLACYPLFLVGVLILPARPLTQTGWIKVMLDMGTLILIWIFLFIPQVIAGAGAPLLNQLISIAYPISDLVLLWAMLLLLHRMPHGKNQAPLLLLSFGAGIMIITDNIYGYQSLMGKYTSGGLVDLGWTITFILFAIAGIWQAQSVHPDNSFKVEDSPIDEQENRYWVSYLPYAWIFIPIFLLIWSLDHPFLISYPLLVLGGSFIIGLFLIRQVVSSRETTQRAAELRILLKRVQQQTVELEEINRDLQFEIQERKEVEKTLRESENKYRSLTQTAKDAIISVDNQGRIISWNDGAEVIFGYTADEIIGESLLRITPPELDIPQRIQAESSKLKDNLPWLKQKHEFSARRKNGEIFPTEITFSSWTTCEGIFFTAIVRDVTERKLSEAALKKAYQENKFLLSSISSILIGVNSSGKVTYWNDIAADTLKIPAPQALGQTFFDLAIEWDWEPIRQAIAECRYSLQKVSANDVKGIKGKIFGISITPLTESEPASLGFLLLGSDITTRKTMERQLAQASKLESIGQLAAGIAHEINTPTQYVSSNLRFMRERISSLWNVIQLYRSLVEAVQTGGPTYELAARAEQAAAQARLDYILNEFPPTLDQSLDGMNRISHIVSAMRTFSRPDNDTKIFSDVNHILDDTVTVARTHWKTIATLSTDYDPNLPKLACYPAELSQVFLNIIINASDSITDALKDEARFTALNGMGQISVSTCALSDRIEVRIGDTGTGIPSEIQDRIFDPFFTTKEVGQGTGQGLAIAYNIVVNKHAGSITFETEPGVGTTFIIALPLS